eukprot:jgi/Mesvir1/16569/Mv10108-RA.3
MELPVGEPMTQADVANVYSLLQWGLSADENARRPAEEALTGYEERRGFCSCLLEILRNQAANADHGVRWLAVVYFKNMVNRNWRGRRNSNTNITDEEKVYLRAQLLSLVGEPNQQISIQLALLVARIARIDYPRDWPELFPTLLARLQAENNPGTVQQIYLTLHHVLKELSSKRLVVDQKNFHQVAAQLLAFMWGSWCNDCATITALLPSVFGPPAPPPAQAPPLPAPAFQPSPEQAAMLTLCASRWLLCTKIVLRCILFGVVSDVKTLENVDAVIQLVPIWLRTLITHLPYWPAASSTRHPLAWVIEKGCVKLMKGIARLQATHPYTFGRHADVMTSMLSFCFDQVVARDLTGSGATPSGADAMANGAAMNGSWSPAHAVSREDGNVTDGRNGAAPHVPIFSRFLVECLVLFQNTVKCHSYKDQFSEQMRALMRSAGGQVSGPTLAAGETIGSPMARRRSRIGTEVRATLDAFFTPERIKVIVSALVWRFFQLSSEDWEEWSANAEEWAHEQDAAHWQEQLRPCAEACFLVLLGSYGDPMLQVVMDMLRSVSEACPPGSLGRGHVDSNGGAGQGPGWCPPEVLLKDAVYNAVGLASFDLQDTSFDFAAWFTQCLVPEVTSPANNNPTAACLRIIRRRVAIILRAWASKVCIRAELMPTVYSLLCRLLEEGEDLAVRLAACEALRDVVDANEFAEEAFLPYAAPLLDRMFRLVQASTELESQVKAFVTISVIIQRVGPGIRPFAARIIELVPQVWAVFGSSEQSLVRVQVLLTLQQLVVALAEESPLCYERALMPVLAQVTDINQPDELNLLEDGLNLWHVTVSHAPALTPELLALVPNAAGIMARSFEHVEILMRILESYILLGGVEFLRVHAMVVVGMMESMVGAVSDQGMMLVLPVLDLFIQCLPSEEFSLLEPLLVKLVASVFASDASELLRANICSLVARIMLHNPPFFKAAFEAMERQRGVVPCLQALPGERPVLFCLVDVWLEQMDAMTTTPKRKLCALALALLLGVPDANVLARFPLLISAITGVLHETEGDPTVTPEGQEYWVTRSDAVNDDFQGSALEIQRRELVRASLGTSWECHGRKGVLFMILFQRRERLRCYPGRTWEYHWEAMEGSLLRIDHPVV